MSLETIPSVLACDVGNSAVRIAHVKGEEVEDYARFAVGDLGQLGSAIAELWARLPDPKKLVACSVNPAALKALEAAVSDTLHVDVLVIGRDLPLPIDTELTNPESVGADRVCAAAAAFDRLGVACVVGDFGTATTIDCVSDEGVFLGGAILPGLQMAADALNQRTAQLPPVTLRDPDWTYGRDTQQAIVGGIVFGARGALRELVEAYATDLGSWPLVILTGSHAPLVCPHPGENGIVQAIVPDLVLRGVAMAYYRFLINRAR